LFEGDRENDGGGAKLQWFYLKILDAHNPSLFPVNRLREWVIFSQTTTEEA